jgi:heptosyltransferase II
MDTLIIKLNATGDVVRTTTLLHRLPGQVTWITAAGNAVLLDGVSPRVRCLTWEQREQALDRPYDLVINLEDEPEVAAFAKGARTGRTFGAYLNGGDAVAYTEDARRWFDMSLISVYGRQRADELKLQNRSTYQELIFEGLGFAFENEPYVLPAPAATDLHGDVAIAPVAGPVWPMKNWSFYDDLKKRLEADGLRVNVLPRRATLLEHMGDVRNHRALVCGDSLPMHLALGMGTPCVTIFNCTSPWEIHDYGLQTKIVSPLLERFFYKRGYDETATSAIGVDEVYAAVKQALREAAVPALQSQA